MINLEMNSIYTKHRKIKILQTDIRTRWQGCTLIATRLQFSTTFTDTCPNTFPCGSTSVISPTGLPNLGEISNYECKPGSLIFNAVSPFFWSVSPVLPDKWSRRLVTNAEELFDTTCWLAHDQIQFHGVTYQYDSKMRSLPVAERSFLLKKSTILRTDYVTTVVYTVQVQAAY